MRNETTYPGLVIRSHCVRDASSKLRASKTLKGWQFVEQTAAAWVSELEQGHTIQPSLFVKTPDGTYFARQKPRLSECKRKPDC